MRRALVVAAVTVGAACAGPEPTPEPTPAPTTAATPDNGGPISPQAPAWQALPTAPTARTEVAAAAADGRIVVAGGFAQGGAATAAVEIYDVGSQTWKPGPDLPRGAVHHTMAAADGETVYLVGGYVTAGFDQPGNRALALRGDTWEELPPMPEPRAAGGAAVIDGDLFVAGGVGGDGLATTMLVYDLDRGAWSTRPGPPTSREHLAVAAAAGRLYVVGGRTGGIGTNLATAEVHDPASGQWQTLEDLPTARGGIGAAATDNGLVVVAGGEEQDGTFAEVEAFDVDTRRWITLPPLPTARHGLGVAAVGAVVHVVAGGPEPGLAFSAAHEAVDLSTHRSADDSE